MTTSRRFLLGLLAAFALCLGPSCSSGEDLPLLPPFERTHESDVINEPELVAKSGLSAHLGSTVVLSLEHPEAAPSQEDDTGPSGVDIVPYELAVDENVRLCFGDADAVRDVVLRDERGETVLEVQRGGPCAATLLRAGHYEAYVTRDPAAGREPILTFLAATPLDTPQCQPSELRADPASHPTNVWELVTPTEVLLASSSISLGPDPTRFDPSQGLRITSAATPGVNFWRGTQFVSSTQGMLSVSSFVPPGPIPALWKMTSAGNDPFTFVISGSDPVLRGAGWSRLPLSGTNARVFIYPAYATGVLPFTLAMRFAPTPADVGSLAVGEVALYEQPNFGGRAWVVNASHKFPSNLSRIVGIDSFSKIKSLRVGCDTTANVWPIADRSGAAPFRYGADTPQLGHDVGTLVIGSTKQITIQSKRCDQCNLRRADFRASALPPGTSLSGVHFVDGTLEGARFDGQLLEGALFERVRLEGASFIGAKLPGATFRGTTSVKLPATGAFFDGATLDRTNITDVDFSRGSFSKAAFGGLAQLTSVDFDTTTFNETTFAGATLRDVAFTAADLTSSDLTGVSFELMPGHTLAATPCATPRVEPPPPLTRFARTAVRYDQVPMSVWRKVNLNDSRIDTASAPQVADKATLCGLYLRRVQLRGWSLRETKLDQSSLDAASFSTAKLFAASLTNASLVGTDFAFADLTGAVFDGAVADNGNQPANFNLALFAPASLKDARFSKATFHRARVKMPPAAMRIGANFVQPDFSEANLSGSDLSGMSLLGGIFTNASFAGANLRGADLSEAPLKGGGTSPSKLQSASFCGADIDAMKLRGAQLANAFFPAVDTTVSNLNGTGTVACARVVLGPTNASLDDVETSGAQCPSGATAFLKPPKCTATEWNLTSGTVPVPLCPPPQPGQFSDELEICEPCTSNCECVSHQCVAGRCGPCAQ